MKLVITSDTHQSIHSVRFPEGDVLIHCGDMSGDGSIEQINLTLETLARQNYKKILYVPGNHDKAFVKHPDQIFQHEKLINMHERSLEIDGIKFYGTSWMLDFPGDWVYTAQEEELKEKYKSIPKDTHVLITHCPPNGIMDGLNNGGHIGPCELKKAIRKKTPAIHVFGHCHEHNGWKAYANKNGRTTVFLNASFVTPNAPGTQPFTYEIVGNL